MEAMQTKGKLWRGESSQNGLSETDAVLAQVLRSCNQLRTITDITLKSNTAEKRDDLVRWRQSCSQTIALPRDILRFEVSFSTVSLESSDEPLQVQLSQSIAPEMVFHRIESVLIDGQPVSPTNKCLSQTLDLHFNRVASGQKVQIAYFARVRFNAEPFRVRLSELNLQSFGTAQTRENQSVATQSPSLKRHVTIGDSVHRMDPEHALAGNNTAVTSNRALIAQ